MSIDEPPFRPLADRTHFPLLSGGDDLPCGNLMGCEHLVFMAPVDLSATRLTIGKEGVEWHLYGDTRWPSPAVWIEFCTSPGGFSGRCGVLVMRVEIPADERDWIEWVANNNPLQQIFPPERGEAVIQQKLEMLRAVESSTEKVSGPVDSRPRFIQSYCIYREDAGVKLVASYTDHLNADGIPIPKYRMASVQPYDVDFCRFALNALFRLNTARLAGMKFIAIPQFQTCEPAWLLPDHKNPKWVQFHPSRILRTRPALRALPTPEKMMDGIMMLEDAQEVMNVRRREANLHMLAFELSTRRGTSMMEDGNASMSAFVHRANGGAIYVLPDRLVEEFDNTDCNEIQISDLKLPFPTLFLKFTPPQPLVLAEGAPVDGCYIAKQGDEYFVMLTSHWEGVDYARSLSVACLDPTFGLHLPAPAFDLNNPGQDTELTVNAAVEMGIAAFLKENAPPTDDMSQTITRPDGTTTFIEDVRAKSRQRRITVFQSQEPVFRACLNIIVNAACFISFQPEDITDEWEGEPPAWAIEALNNPSQARRDRDRKISAVRTVAAGDYTRIKICGKSLFSDAHQESGPGHGISPRAHWRRGHWRRQRHGVGLSLTTPRWIRPTIVKKDNGPLVEARIYDVQKLSPNTDVE